MTLSLALFTKPRTPLIAHPTPMTAADTVDLINNG